VINRLLPYLYREAITVTGKALVEGAESASTFNEDVIRPLDRPI
jgi:hypothetical protein